MIDLVEYARLASRGIILEQHADETETLEPEVVQDYLENEFGR